MNIVDIIILVIFAYCLLAGMYKGSLASGLSLAGFAGAWFGAKSLYQSVANLALSNTTLMAVLNQYLEPETFFKEQATAVMNVVDVISGGEASISAAVASVGKNFAFLQDAFSANVRNQAFANLGISSMADYFNQTLWMAVFNVAAFVLTFIALYAILVLIVNMLDHVIAFPVWRSCDWLIGGVLGLFRAVVVVALVLNILPALTTLLNPQLTSDLIAGSKLYPVISQLDFGVSTWIAGLVMG